MIEKTDAKKDARGINSVEIGYRVLLAVQRGPGTVNLVEIAKRTGLSTGAAHNYLVSLVRTGLIEQEGRGRYRLGPSAFALSLTSFQQLNGYDVMRGEALRLHRLTGQSSAVSVWSQGGPVSVFVQHSEALGSFELRPGLVKMTASGAGVVYAGYLPATMTAKLIGYELGEEAGGERTTAFVDRARKSVRANGYGRHEHGQPGFYALAAPVITENAQIAFVLSLVLGRVVDAEIEDLWLKALQDCAQHAAFLIAGLPASGPHIETLGPA